MSTKEVLYNGIVVGSIESTDDLEEDRIASEKVLKEKGLLEKIPIYKRMRGHAASFATVAQRVYEKDLKVSPFYGPSIPPFVVNATFAVEVYLKSMHAVFGNMPKGHKLIALYKGLPREGKSHLERSGKDVRPLYPVDIRLDLEGCIGSLSEAFVNWRYVYEHERLDTELQLIRYTMHSCHEAANRCIESKEASNKALKSWTPNGAA